MDLTYALLVASMLQPTPQRLYAACVAFVLLAGHTYQFGDSEGLWYYCTGALANLATIAILAGVRPIPKMVLRLQWICVASIAVNFVGWVMWRLYLPPDLYNAAFVLIHVWTLVTLIRRGKADHVGGYRIHRWCSDIRHRAHPRHVLDTQNGGTI